MKNKNKVIIGMMVFLIILIIVATAYLVWDKSEKETEAKNIFFSKNSTDWIYDNPSTPEKDTKIDVFMATQGKTRLQPGQQDYSIDGSLTSFFYSGMYKGKEFQSTYVPEGFENSTFDLTLKEKKRRADEIAPIRITNEFNPNDGQINGFILAKYEEGKMAFYIFLDEDWKEQLQFTNIMWGEDLRNLDTINMKRFDFSDGKDGIYIEKITKDTGWHEKEVIRGGIAVGEINKGIVSDLMRDKKLNITYIMLR